MDRDYYQQHVLPLVKGGEGCGEEYSSEYEFKQHLIEDERLAGEKLEYGWVFWREWAQLVPSYGSHKVINLLKEIAKTYHSGEYYLIQFWAEVEVKGRHHGYLSTLHQPFYVGGLRKGLSWYRKECMGHGYPVDVEGTEAAEDLGGVGRAYRSKRPESTPDLRLYSTNEFPLRDLAALCGFRAYLALPLFDFHNQNQCYGVLEFLFPSHFLYVSFPRFYEKLEIAGLRSTHTHNRATHIYSWNQLQQDESEITETLEFAIKVVPRLSLAQVWVPCRAVGVTPCNRGSQPHCTQCGNSRCMERAYYVYYPFDTRSHIKVSPYLTEVREYVHACTLINLPIDVDRYLCNVSICKNPLAHYAQRARFSLGFVAYLQSEDHASNHSHVIEFFLQPQHREDSSVQLLLRIIQAKLKNFKLVLGEKILEELMAPNPVELGCIDMLKSMDSCEDTFSESGFTKYLETDDLCCFRPYTNGDSEYSFRGWVFHSPVQEAIHKIRAIEEKIQHFMKEIADIFRKSPLYIANGSGGRYCMVQFWAPVMVEDRCCLKTWDEPYALNCLTKGLASFRKECIKHHYPVDEEAREEELGPIGRAFRNGHPEVLYDLVSYTTKEFPMRNYALYCGIKRYYVLPVFDKFNRHDCVGVLEFLGFRERFFYRGVKREFVAAELFSSHFYSHPITYAEVNNGAMAEIKIALDLISKIPQCDTVNVWIPYGKCRSRRMQWLNPIKEKDSPLSELIRVEPKIGMIGIVLQSESKVCFCQNTRDFSIAKQPLEYYGRKIRSNTCFAICLQSSHTGDMVYAFEFFLYQSPATYEYLMSFLNFLQPILKYELKSFKIAFGKQLGEEELVVEVVQFSNPSQFTLADSNQLNEFPIKFRSVMYGLKGHQHIAKQQVLSNPGLEQRKQPDVVASDFKVTGKGKAVSIVASEVLKPHFEKKLEDVAEELDDGRSTSKRACTDYGIDRWLVNKKQVTNPSLVETESTLHDLHEIPGPSSSSWSSLRVLDTSLQQNTNTQPLLVEDEVEKATIKVKYEKDVI